jgi:hypothetical protein
MPPFGPIKRTELARALRRAGFSGPFPGRKHQVMIRSISRVRFPNPHQQDVSKNLIIREAGISREAWEKL